MMEAEQQQHEHAQQEQNQEEEGVSLNNLISLPLPSFLGKRVVHHFHILHTLPLNLYILLVGCKLPNSRCVA